MALEKDENSMRSICFRIFGRGYSAKDVCDMMPHYNKVTVKYYFSQYTHEVINTIYYDYSYGRPLLKREVLPFSFDEFDYGLDPPRYSWMELTYQERMLADTREHKNLKQFNN